MARMGEIRNPERILVGNLMENVHLEVREKEVER
jgi:hypothetical protein